MAVELGISNEPQLVPGMFVTVQWQAQRTAPTLVVPTTAIASELQRTFVVRVKNGKVKWVDGEAGDNGWKLDRSLRRSAGPRTWWRCVALMNSSQEFRKAPKNNRSY